MKHVCQRLPRLGGGFTLVEVLIVMFIMVVISAIALPSFMGWRKNLKYRETAREVASMLREAKSRAITNNLEQQVMFDPNPGISTRYGMRPGTRAYMQSADWDSDSAVSTWTVLDSQVKIDASTKTVPSAEPTNPPGSLQFTPNGAASAQGIVKIKDQDSATKFCVSVSSAGRISVLVPDPVNCTNP